jgi:hypothetical protein
MESRKGSLNNRGHHSSLISWNSMLLTTRDPWIQLIHLFVLYLVLGLDHSSLTRSLLTRSLAHFSLTHSLLTRSSLLTHSLTSGNSMLCAPLTALVIRVHLRLIASSVRPATSLPQGTCVITPGGVVGDGRCVCSAARSPAYPMGPACVLTTKTTVQWGLRGVCLALQVAAQVHRVPQAACGYQPQLTGHAHIWALCEQASAAHTSPDLHPHC